MFSRNIEVAIMVKILQGHFDENVKKAIFIWVNYGLGNRVDFINMDNLVFLLPVSILFLQG